MFPDLSAHADWLRGQTIAWCNQLAAQTGKYAYTWNYSINGIGAEDVFQEELATLVHGK